MGGFFCDGPHTTHTQAEPYPRIPAPDPNSMKRTQYARRHFLCRYFAIHHACSASRAKQNSAQKWGQHTPPRGIRPAKLVPRGETEMPRGELFFSFENPIPPGGEINESMVRGRKGDGGRGKHYPGGKTPNITVDYSSYNTRAVFTPTAVPNTCVILPHAVVSMQY